MFYLYILGILCVVYYYRRFVFFNFLKSVLLIFKWKIHLSRSFTKNDDKILNNSCCVIDNLLYVYYKITYNEKDFDQIYVSKTNSDTVRFEKNIIESLCKRNWIVHANITDFNSNILFDVTDEFRKFCYYFGTDTDLNVFYRWFDKTIVENVGSDINIYDCYLVVFLNDDNFSETKIEIKNPCNFSIINLESKNLETV